MRLKDFFYMLGFKPKGKKYGHTQVTYQLPDDGTVDFAYWEHPRFDGFKIEQDHISALRKFLKPGDVAIDIEHIVETRLSPWHWLSVKKGMFCV